MSKIQLLLDVVEDLRSLAESVQAVANAMLQSDAEVETPAPAPAPKPEPRKVVTLEQVRAVLAEKSHDGFTADVRALLHIQQHRFSRRQGPGQVQQPLVPGTPEFQADVLLRLHEPAVHQHIHQ